MSVKGHHTGMAGEFAVMERLHRLGHQPALTLGNAKTVDILSKSPSGKIFQISVKAIQGGGKWGVGKFDYSAEQNLIFVLLHYRKFDDVHTQPEVWVLPAAAVMQLRRPWLNNGFAIYCMNQEFRDQLASYRDRWDYLDAEPSVQPLSAPTPASTSMAIRSFGGVLARGVMAMNGFRAKYGAWPTSLQMGQGSLEVLRTSHLTPVGMSLLEAKVKLLVGADESVHAHGNQGETFDYGAEPTPAHLEEDAGSWIGLYCCRKVRSSDASSSSALARSC